MSNRMKLAAFAAAAACAMSLISTTASAQTVANGPYYATPSWDQKLQCDSLATCPRFVVLANWNSEAVLDRETGLVWQKSVGTGLQTFGVAFENCITAGTGGRSSWRLPTVYELRSLLDPLTGSLPSGHPFKNVITSPSASGRFWSATPVPSFSAFYVQGFNATFFAGSVPTNTELTWCVRGQGGQ